MLSQVVFGFLSDRFGRKKIIVIKILVVLIFVVTLIVLGLIGNIIKEAVIAMYFISLFFATFTLDLITIGFESVVKENRENYIILLAATKSLSICLLCGIFYFCQKWVYFYIIVGGLLLITVGLLIKFMHESPHFVLASTADTTMCKYVLNCIAETNDEEMITEQIEFKLDEIEIKKRRGCLFRLKNMFNSKQKFLQQTILSIQWFAYMSAQMLQIVFMEQVNDNPYVNLVFISLTEVLASLFSKVMIKFFSRRLALFLLNGVAGVCFFFLLIFPNNSQSMYALGIILRADLSIMLNVL